ncbi:hypothetical protein [Nannocystis bainbridge]|uniref:Uncharacterized protein n=1 Tax=Nannocystis bainbridge TaxID=2995303 RepID=A0ABT5E8M1_9BACT|nr:hypothetical protein [Nannocystis bainbridge]MDC0721689.1 hypothetical protein [Nannocystis bainbridge]
MTIIQTLDLEPLVADVVADVLHSTAPGSVNVVVPPGFGDRIVGSAIVERLREAAGGVPVAELTMDEIPDVRTFIARLAAGLCRPFAADAADSDLALKSLLRAGEHPAIYVLRRFHCTLDTLPPWMLACLRTAEEDNLARAVVMAPASHRRLKRRWEKKGHPMIASDYGNSHDKRIVRLRGAAAIATLRPKSVPPHVYAYALKLTGGYPEVLARVLGAWERGGASIKLDRVLQQKLCAEALAGLVRFAEWLDHDDDAFFQGKVIDVYHRFDRDDAVEAVRQHELHELILDGDELRAGSLGPAALQCQREALLREDPNGQRRARVRARQLYLRADYSEVLRLLADEPRPAAATELLRHHATIMHLLTDVEPGLDTDWPALLKAIGEAQRWLDRNAEVDETGQLRRRYADLSQIARTIHGISDVRIVDRLGEPVADDGFDHDRVRAALFLLTLHFDGANRRRGPAGALRDGLALPEQLLRVWARWQLGLDYYRAPVLDPAIVAALTQVWDKPDSPLKLPTVGESFPSLWSFALYAGALLDARALGERAPERSAQELMKSLQFLVARNDPAHALATAKRALRDRYLELCDRWLTAVFAVAPAVGDLTRGELLRILLPLPLLEDGSLDWSPAVSDGR